MKKLKIIFIIFLFLPLNHLKADELNKTSKITKNLRCLICQGQSVYDSDSEFANSVKILVERKLDQGFEENEIYDFLRKKYGNWIIYDPVLSLQTIFLWFIPLILFILGGFLIFKKVIIVRK